MVIKTRRWFWGWEAGWQMEHAFLGLHLILVVVITIAKTVKTDLLGLHVPKLSEDKRSWNILHIVKTKDFIQLGHKMPDKMASGWK